jgi:hypothetical protein
MNVRGMTGGGTRATSSEARVTRSYMDGERANTSSFRREIEFIM